MHSQGVPGKREVLIPSAPVCALGQLPLISKGSLCASPGSILTLMGDNIMGDNMFFEPF